jgi:hypothetical protein
MYIWWGLGKESEADEIERKEMERIESQFVIPSNGDGPIRIVYKKTFQDIDNTLKWRVRDDCYYVYNYKPADSLYLLNYMDSVRFNKWFNRHSLRFYWYNSTLPDTVSEQSFNEVLPEFKYWEITYQKGQDIYIYWQKGRGLNGKNYSHLFFKYDKIRNKYVSE